MRGVVYTLKRLFLRIQPESDGQSSRSSSSTLEFNDNSAMEMMNYRLEKGNIMKILFDLLLKYSPSDITSIALQSQIFASRMGDRIYEFLEKRCERYSPKYDPLSVYFISFFWDHSLTFVHLAHYLLFVVYVDTINNQGYLGPRRRASVWHCS